MALRDCYQPAMSLELTMILCLAVIVITGTVILALMAFEDEDRR